MGQDCKSFEWLFIGTAVGVVLLNVGWLMWQFIAVRENIAYLVFAVIFLVFNIASTLLISCNVAAHEDQRRDRIVEILKIVTIISLLAAVVYLTLEFRNKDREFFVFGIIYVVTISGLTFMTVNCYPRRIHRMKEADENRWQTDTGNHYITTQTEMSDQKMYGDEYIYYHMVPNITIVIVWLILGAWVQRGCNQKKCNEVGSTTNYYYGPLQMTSLAWTLVGSVVLLKWFDERETKIAAVAPLPPPYDVEMLIKA